MNPISKIMLGIGAALAVIVIAGFVWLLLANAHLKTLLAEARSDDTACHMVNDLFATLSIKQNKAIAAINEAQITRQRQAQAALNRAQKTAAVYKKAALQLAARKPQSDNCASSEALLNDYLKGLP